MSLRTRLIISYTLIVVLCLSIIAVSVTVLLQGYRDQFAIARLEAMSRPIYVQFGALARGQQSWNQVLANLEEQADNNDIHILLTDDEGSVAIQVSPGEKLQEQAIEVSPGELPHGISQRTEGTFVTTDQQAFVFVAYPIGRSFQDRTPSAIDALVLCVPRGEASAILASLARPFLLAGLIALAISATIAVLLARSIYRPIRRVTEAVDNMAEGRWDQQVPLAGPKEIKGLASHFNELAAKLDQSQRQMRHFVADVAHQLKSPLTSIRGFAGAILDGTADDPDKQIRAAQVIDEESKRMIRQVDELLELSRMQAGQTQMTRELIDIKELLVHCEEVFSMRVEEKDIQLKTEIEPLMPVVGDVDRLEQVFSNLLDNALKNTPSKGEVRVAGRNSPGNCVEITVADSGPGIPPEQLPYVFERFYQAGGLRTGVGLGLAIAKEIVLAHGGRIQVSSNPGEETKFVVTLPAGASSSFGPL